MRPQEQKGLTIPGTAAPQCGKSGIWTAPEIIGFPGTAAPQCGSSSEVTEADWA
ncbi:MAG: hypothetical protein NTV14_09980 [Coprothermobacterota bacterium]|nr:hypothetical protein [Coprothermobacterota bacterium]